MAQVPLERVVIQAVAVLVGIGASLLAPALALDAPALLVALLLCCLFDLTGHRARTALVLASFGLLALWKPFSAFGLWWPVWPAPAKSSPCAGFG